MTTYAITAATGQLGSLVITELLDRGVAPIDLIAVVRDRAKAQAFENAGVQVRVADYEQPAALEEAFSGVDRPLADQ